MSLVVDSSLITSSEIVFPLIVQLYIVHVHVIDQVLLFFSNVCTCC